MAKWEDITPLLENGKPAPQRVLINSEYGVPTLRILPDTTYRVQAWWHLAYGGSFLTAGMGAIPFAPASAMPGIALVLLTGLILTVPALWAGWGETAFRVFPARVEVSWGLGWLRWRKPIDRMTAQTIVLSERTGRYLPMPMSGSGLLAALSLESAGTRVPLLLTRAIVTNTVASWLAHELDISCDCVDEPFPDQEVETESLAEELERLGGGWVEIEVDQDVFGTPQRLWARHGEDAFEVAVLTDAAAKTVWKRVRPRVYLAIGGAVLAVTIPVVVDDSFRGAMSSILIAAIMAMVLGGLSALIELMRRPSYPLRHLSTLRFTENSVSLMTPMDTEAESVDRKRIEHLSISDMEGWVVLDMLFSGLLATPAQSFVLSVCCDDTDLDLILQLHPATAELLAELIHEETGIPIEREYV